jgi:nicotinate-nucleotide pyrophosphorylase (carboxylating)
MHIPLDTVEFIKRAVAEDIGRGDITTSLLVPPDQTCTGRFIAKGRFVIAGWPFAAEALNAVDPWLAFEPRVHEGAWVRSGQCVGEVHGLTTSVLSAERVALNILQRLSGVATLAARFAAKAAPHGARVLDTRKTTPGMRFMEKYAVRMGGGHNHRHGLDDGILIKDNHIASAGGVAEAVLRAKGVHPFLKIEVEASSLDQVREALEAGAEIIMLDNMPTDLMKRAVKLIAGRAVTEASGNVTLRTVEAVARTGVDCVSVGALTHSAPAADISLRIEASI